jgi:hypothetical protein
MSTSPMLAADIARSSARLPGTTEAAWSVIPRDTDMGPASRTDDAAMSGSTAGPVGF